MKKAIQFEKANADDLPGYGSTTTWELLINSFNVKRSKKNYNYFITHSCKHWFGWELICVVPIISDFFSYFLFVYHRIERNYLGECL